MDIAITITEIFPEQKGMNVHYSTPTWPEGRTVFMLFPVDTQGVVLQGEALMAYLADRAPVTECEHREALMAEPNTDALSALVGVAVIKDVPTATERKVAQILATAPADTAPAIADMISFQP